MNDNKYEMTVRKISSEEQTELYNRICYFEGSEYKKYMPSCAASKDYSEGKQWTKDELTANRARGQYCLTVNRYKKAIKSIAGMLSASIPKYSCIPFGIEDSAKSDLANRLLNYIFYKSHGKKTNRTVIYAALRDKISYFQVTLDYKNEVIYMPKYYDEILIDPSSRDSMFRDADWIYEVKYLPVSRVKEIYGIDDLSSDIPKEWSAKVAVYDDTNKTGILVDSNKQYCKVYEGRHKEYSKNEDGTIKVEIKMQTIVGYNHVAEWYLPPSITEYDIIPVYTEESSNPYKPGMYEDLKELQDIINKSVGTILLSAQLHSNPKIWLPKSALTGSLQDMTTNYAKVGGINVYNDSLEGKPSTPTVIAGQPINQSFYELLMFFLKEFEIVSIPTEASLRDSGQLSTDDLIAKREQIMDSLRTVSDIMDESFSQLGTVLIQYAKSYYPKNKLIKLISGDSIVGDTMINQEVDIDDPKQVAAYIEQRVKGGDNAIFVKQEIEEARIADDKKKAVDFILDPVNELDLDVQVVPGSSNPSFDNLQFSSMIQLKGAGINIDDEDLLNRAPLEDRKRIALKASMNKALSIENEQLRQQLEDMGGMVKKLTDKATGLEQDVVLTKFEYDKHREVSDMRDQKYVQKHVAKNQYQNMIKDAKRDIDIKLKELELLRQTMIAQDKLNNEPLEITLNDIFNKE